MSYNLKVKNPYKKDGAYDFVPPYRQFGAGPCNSSLEVLNAFVNQPITFSNYHFKKIADEIQEMAKYVLQTNNQYTVVDQLSGNGGNEALIVNLADPGDTVIVATAGVWGMKVADFGRRNNLNVIELKIGFGEVYTVDQLEKEIIKHKPVALFVTHGESSGGTLQPLHGLGAICHKYDCLLAVDAVMSLGVAPLLTDEWQLDAVSAATQKGLGAPSGMCLITLSDRAYKRMTQKKHPTPYIFDFSILGDMWRCYEKPRRYFHTYNTQMLMCVRQALIEICEEGLDNVWRRHQRVTEHFLVEAKKLGIHHVIEKKENRFYGVSCVSLPKDIIWPKLYDFAFENYNIEFGVGIGPTVGKGLRVSFLAQNAKTEVVDHFIKILAEGFQYIRSHELDLKDNKTLKVLSEWAGNLSGETFEKNANNK